MDAHALLRPVFEGRDIVFASGPVQGKAGMVQTVRELGARRVVVIGSMGTGPMPDAECVLLESHATDHIEEFRWWERTLASPPREIRDAIAGLERPLVMTSGIEASTHLGEIPIFGARPPRWTVLEDKTTVDGFWDSIGVARPPSEVVAVRDAWAAHSRVDVGDGTVWAGDASQGFNGGGVFVHRVRSRAHADAAIDHLSSRCDRVRVAPFLEGVPCSIHGLVTADDVAVLRPVELLILRTPREHGFKYCGCATTWDPAPGDREAMRSLARVVADALRERVDFRGFFTVDGIMTVDGFRPTELNPRTGGGLSQLRAGLPEFPIGLLHLAVVAGAVEVDARALEATLLPPADERRVRQAWTVVFGTPVESEDVLERDGFSITRGPAPEGTFVRGSADESLAPAGESFAPVAARLFAAADEHWSLGLGPLESATDVRRGALLEE